MATFLRWSSSATGTKEQFLVSMFSTLSPRYYPTNVIGSGLYDMLSMYAEELEDLYTENQQAFDDLAIETVRTTNIITRNSSKIYDNFGVLLRSSRRFAQSFNTFDSASVIQSYRQQLRFLTNAFVDGISVVGLESLGRSYSGIAPIIEEHIKANPRWVLSAYTGSVLSVGENFIISDVFIPRVGNIIPTDNVDIFSPGDNFAMSFTHLGSNTKLSGEDLFYNTVVNTYYIRETGVSSQSVTDTKNSIEFQVLRQIRADQRIRESYSEDFDYYRPYLAYSESVGGSGDGIGVEGTISTLSSDLAIHPLGFLYNTGRLHASGSIHVTPVIDLGDQYNQFRWHYDWLVNTRENGSYSIEVRQYATASIPDTLYYIPIVGIDEAIPPILPEVSGSMLAHWFNVQSQSVFDAKGVNSLNASSVPSYTPKLSRDPRRHSFLYAGAITFESTEVHSELDFGGSMYTEMWLLREITPWAGADSALTIQREQGNNYYKIIVNTTSKTLNLVLNKEGQVGSASVPIHDYLNLVTPFPQYFAVSYVSGSVSFFANGELVGTGSIADPPDIPAMPLATQSIIVGIASLGIDEIVLSDGNLDVNTAKNNFLSTRPRHTGVGIPPSSVERYQQAKFILNGYNVRDTELHQFSIRGFNSGSITKYLNPYFNYPYVLPLFKKI